MSARVECGSDSGKRAGRRAGRTSVLPVRMSIGSGLRKLWYCATTREYGVADIPDTPPDAGAPFGSDVKSSFHVPIS